MLGTSKIIMLSASKVLYTLLVTIALFFEYNSYFGNLFHDKIRHFLIYSKFSI